MNSKSKGLLITANFRSTFCIPGFRIHETENIKTYKIISIDIRSTTMFPIKSRWATKMESSWTQIFLLPFLTLF